jgi:dihydropteroate synthase
LSQIKKLDLFKDWYHNPNKKTLVMGVLNVTPDSFSDGGEFFAAKDAIQQAMNLISNGAHIIDVGGESSRPGAVPLSVPDELERVVPVIKGIRERSPEILISIDTYKSEVAGQAIESGANIVNDISGLGFDKNMPNIIAGTGVPVIIMHMQGMPNNMQNNPDYNNLIADICSFFSNQVDLAISAGIKKDQIILDPGIGFGKTMDHNFKLIQQLNQFLSLGFPLMVGPSRKSFIGNFLNVDINERIEGTAAVVVASIMNGARIVRVHDIKEIKRVVQVVDKIRMVQ